MKEPWFKFYTSILNSAKVKRLTPAQRWIYVALLCMAKDSDMGGLIGIDENTPYSQGEILDMVGVDRKGFLRFKSRALALNLVLEKAPKTPSEKSFFLYIPDYEEKQNSRNGRNKRYYENKKEEKIKTRIKTQIKTVDIDTDKDIDKDKEIYKEKEKSVSSASQKKQRECSSASKYSEQFEEAWKTGHRAKDNKDESYRFWQTASKETDPILLKNYWTNYVSSTDPGFLMQMRRFFGRDKHYLDWISRIPPNQPSKIIQFQQQQEDKYSEKVGADALRDLYPGYG